MKKILMLFVLLSCISVYGEEITYIYDNVSQEVINTNKGTIKWEPYMQELEKTIKKNWWPLKDYSLRRTVVRFVVAKDGNLYDLKILKSSRIKQIDEAALNAVRKSAPFKPLPKEYNGNAIPIEYTFDIH